MKKLAAGAVLVMGLLLLTGSAFAAPPSDGSVGNADGRNDRHQPDGDKNKGYECDDQTGVGDGNPAHSGCDEETPTTEGNTPTTAGRTTTTVENTTTTAVSGETVQPSTTVSAEVEGETITTQAELPKSLATTGATLNLALALGVVLTLSGIFLVKLT